MKKYIYKLTNLINGKTYIGQTNNIKRRMHEHLHDKRANKPIGSALRMYGKENFDFYILYYGEDYNAEEIKWIKYYNSNSKSHGYNIQTGGQDSVGENNPASKITQRQADEIISMLLTKKMTFNEISKLIDVPTSLIKHINSGYSWRNDSLYKYPLNKTKLNEEEIGSIIDLLYNEEISIEEIAEKYKVKKYVILCINRGKTSKKNNINYPIREIGLTSNTIEEIVRLLKDTTLYYKDIAQMTNTSISIVSKINYGTTWQIPDLIYPIRNK